VKQKAGRPGVRATAGWPEGCSAEGKAQNQNIFLNGSVLGLTKKEIDQKIDEIIDFAEIREAIDMPVQNYSSGISVRLGICRRHGARSLL
jgi:ABC-type polysaccharide/polyol phosphate transport system ATPase subunit